MNIACVLDVADITVICTYTVRYYARSTYATAMDLCTLCPKKYTTSCLIITLANVNRFSKFFHLLIREKILCV